ncbi:hypothetical protein [Variovorax guangxiensis]|uniref:hypothetical protein n=1 Tax=Variovorax guangxiensis TaxID=1775474 RepID=UPI00286536EA|nr:hypothetical protein [Variovorax guangxiensis]MDR6858509.1 hypothetical protein [Variovorax guangxiensis]
MKPSLLSALVPVIVFALAMVNGSRADDVTASPTSVVATKAFATAEGPASQRSSKNQEPASAQMR